MANKIKKFAGGGKGGTKSKDVMRPTPRPNLIDDPSMTLSDNGKFLRPFTKDEIDSMNQYADAQEAKETGASLNMYGRLKRADPVKKYAKGGSVKSSASRRGDGCAQRGKTRGKMR